MKNFGLLASGMCPETPRFKTTSLYFGQKAKSHDGREVSALQCWLSHRHWWRMEWSCSSLSWAMRCIQSHLSPSIHSDISSQAHTQGSGALASTSPDKDNYPWLFSPQSTESGVRLNRPWGHLTLSISARQDIFQPSCPEKYNLYLTLANPKTAN